MGPNPSEMMPLMQVKSQLSHITGKQRYYKEVRILSYRCSTSIQQSVGFTLLIIVVN
jgi:hypothetical protein